MTRPNPDYKYAAELLWHDYQKGDVDIEGIEDEANIDVTILHILKTTAIGDYYLQKAHDNNFDNGLTTPFDTDEYD